MSGCGKSDQGEERKRARSEDDDDGDDNGGYQSKRQQTAKTEEAEKPVHFRLSKEMQELTQSGSKYASAASLTKEILIERLKALGELVAVKVVEVRVQTLDAASFSVQIDDKANSVGDLKGAIEESEGTRRYLQELYLVPKKKEGKGKGKASEVGGSSEGEALKDDRKLVENCSVVLCKKAETGAWEKGS